MSNNGYIASISWGVDRCSRLGAPFTRGSFTSDGITAGQRCPVQEHYILAYRE